jgi:hypothetical protein
VVKVAEKIAEVRGMSVNNVAQATTQNFHRFFNISEQSATAHKNQLHQPIQ